MRVARFLTSRLLLLTAVGLVLAGPAAADERHSGNARVPSYFTYPKGRSLAQSYAQPAAALSTVASFNAAPGAVSPVASMSALYQQPATRRLVARQCVLLPRSSVQIRLRAAQAGLTGGPQVLHKFSYSLQYKDIPLSKHTTQSMVITARGNERKVLFSRDRNLPDPDKLPADTRPTVEQGAATRIGLDDARRAVGEILVEVALGEVTEAPRLEIVVDDQGKSELTWTYVVRAKDRKDRFARQYWVAAQGDPRVVLKEDHIYFCGWQEPAAPATAGQATGKIVGNIYGLRKSPLDPPDIDQPLQDYQAANVNGSLVITDTSGQIGPVLGVPLNKTLIGPFAHIINEAGMPLEPATQGSGLAFKANGELELAQVSAFYWVNFAHEFVKPFLPGTPSRLVNNEVHVNINDTCNAFWSSADNSLNFFKAGGGCVNSAYCDVACHEFGHGVDAEFGEILDGAYSEGFGDSLAILITQDSVIGRDFLGRSTPLRNAADPIKWPDVKDDFDPHVAGQPYAGFTWELTRQLITKFGGDDKKAFDTAKELTLGAAALNPRDVPDAVRLVFFVDHQNGSSFFQELANAADSRQIPRPDTPAALNNPANLNVAAK